MVVALAVAVAAMPGSLVAVLWVDSGATVAVGIIRGRGDGVVADVNMMRMSMAVVTLLMMVMVMGIPGFSIGVHGRRSVSNDAATSSHGLGRLIS